MCQTNMLKLASALVLGLIAVPAMAQAPAAKTLDELLAHYADNIARTTRAFPGLSAAMDALEARGVKADDVVVLPYPQHGVKLYGNVVIASEAFLKKHPDAVKAFLRGFTKGVKDTVRDPQAAIATVKARDGLVNTALETRRLKLALDATVLTADARAEGFGAVSPVLDGLAANGIRFTQGYANSPVCSPTRFALMTARYQYRLRGAAEEPINSKSRGSTTLGLPPEHPTLASLLRDAGYRTALIGKWHLGYPPSFGPLRSGYEEFFGPMSGGVDYFTHCSFTGAHDLWFGDAEKQQEGYLTAAQRERASRERLRVAGGPGHRRRPALAQHQVEVLRGACHQRAAGRQAAVETQRRAAARSHC